MASGRLLPTALLLLGLASLAVSQSIIRLPSGNRASLDRKIGGEDASFCESWKFTVETNDVGKWKSIPTRCEEFVKEYMSGGRYLSDFEAVAGNSLDFASTLDISGDGNDAWVFDIDETLLSNLPYYETHGFGSEAFNETSFDEWVDLAEAPALAASLALYRELAGRGVKIFLLTGRSEYQRNSTVKNLLFAGYSNWERLILRRPSDQGKPAIVFKSERRSDLINEGYKIHGSSGDQWSDLLGFATATRSFKLPNPMYYIA